VPRSAGRADRCTERTNLDGCFGINKRWDYWAILAGDLVVSSVDADIDHFGLADVWWADVAAGATGGNGIITTDRGALVLPDRPGTTPLRVERDGFALEIVDGRLTKLGRELHWSYDWDEPLSPWRVVDPGGQLDVRLQPRYDKHTKLPGRDQGSETHQVFGTWSGRLRTDDGIEIEIHDNQGFAEEARQEVNDPGSE
jgi:hypothetical protein